MKKLSIIVPVYNVENYIERGIESLLRQTLKEIEIILVNDGSTDKSLEICKKYKMKDQRIRIIDKQNQGVASARNIGIKYATADYIAFMDPDDEISADMYENLYFDIVKNECDISLCNYLKINKNNKNMIKLPLSEGIYYKDKVEEILINMIWNEKVEKEAIMGSACRSIYKKSIIQKYDLEFPVNIEFMEDLIFMVEYLTKCTKMYINENAYYHYFIRDDSGSTTYKKNLWNNNKKVCQLLEKILKQNNLISKSKKNIANRWIISTFSAISNETHKDNNEKLIEKIKYIKFILNDDIVKRNILLLNKENIKIDKKILLLFIKYKLALPIYIYYCIVRIIKYYLNLF